MFVTGCAPEAEAQDAAPRAAKLALKRRRKLLRSGSRQPPHQGGAATVRRKYCSMPRSGTMRAVLRSQICRHRSSRRGSPQSGTKRLIRCSCDLPTAFALLTPAQLPLSAWRHGLRARITMRSALTVLPRHITSMRHRNNLQKQSRFTGQKHVPTSSPLAHGRFVELHASDCHGLQAQRCQ